MEAIILVGGLGTRLRALVPNMPKPMAPIGDVPFLKILLHNLSLNGFKKIFLITGYKSNLIIDYFGNSFNGMSLIYLNEDFPLGTGGAIKKGLSAIDSAFAFVLNGDTFLDAPFQKIYFECNIQSQNTILCVHRNSTSRYGKLEIHNGFVNNISISSDNSGGYINAGCYLLGKKLFSEMPSTECFSFENDFLAHYLVSSPFKAYLLDSFFIDIGIPDDYLEAQKSLMKYYLLSCAK